MPQYVLIPNRHTGHRANGHGLPVCGARPRVSVIVAELPPSRVPCQLCEPEATPPVVEVKHREATKITKRTRSKRARKGSRTS